MGSLSEKTGNTSPSIIRLVLLLLAVLLLVIIGIFAFLSYKGLRAGNSIQIENKTSTSFLSQLKQLASSLTTDKRTLLKGEDRGRVNILLLGRAGEHYPGRNLTDTIMVMSIDTESKRVALLSLPRDLYVPIPDTGFSTKLNSLYQYGLSAGNGINPIKQSVEEITGMTLDYFVVLDFDGFEQAVNALHGISVDVVRDFHDTRYPGKNYSYETFDIEKGWQTLDGATALKYVRERHDDPEGDFGRAGRQQQVIQAIKDKTFSVGTFLNVFALNDLIDTLGENVKTDMRLEDIEDFLELTKTLDTKNITTLVIDAWEKDSLLRVSHIQVGSVAAFILVPRVGNWSEVEDASDNIFHLDALRERRAHIKSEKATLSLLYQKGDLALAERVRGLIQNNMGLDTVTLVPMSALANRPGQSIIIDRSGLTKPYSLDEFIKEFRLQKESSIPNEMAVSNDSDFVIILGDSLAQALDFEEDPASSLSNDDAAFPEVLPPQPRKKQ